MPTLVIDSREIRVPAETKVIEAAKMLGITIPRFCYHPALGSVGACRVCAVAFNEGPIKGVQMSCMVEAQDGMVVSTTDDEAVDFRRHVLEWLMLHHPHDCPVCDEGGHCLLQDTTIAAGHGLRRFKGKKRTHPDQYLGPLLQHQMNRCIQCYRCSRYYQEFSGYRDLGVMGIGSRVYFGRSSSGCLESTFSGNLIDICPTGVYTDKPSRYIGRRWDFERTNTVCIHCSLGCNMVVSSRYRQVVRHEARLNDDINGHFICDRGRYGYPYASHKNRPRSALADGKPQPMEVVLEKASDQLHVSSARFGSESIATIGSARVSLETLAAMKQICRENRWAGPVAAPTRRMAQNLSTALSHLTPETAVSLNDVAAADTILIIGADPLNEAPMLALALRQVQRRGGHLVVIDPRGIKLPFLFDHWATHPAEMGATIRMIGRAITLGEKDKSPGSEPAGLPILIRQLLWSKRAVVVCGTDSVTHQDIRRAADLVATLRNADINTGLFYTFPGANATACGLLGKDDESIESIVEEIEADRIKALIMVESDGWRHYPDRRRLTTALDRLELLIVMDYLATGLNDRADYFIPTQTIYETETRWINQEGRLQISPTAFKGGEPIALTGKGDHPPRIFENQIPGAEQAPAWRTLYHLVKGKDEDLNSTLIKALNDFHPALTPLDTPGPNRIDFAAITSDPEKQMTEKGSSTQRIVLLLVEQSFGTEPLSAANPILVKLEDTPAAIMHPDTLNRLGLEDDQKISISTAEESLILPLETISKMAPGVVVIPRHQQLNWQIFEDTRVVKDDSIAISIGAGKALFDWNSKQR